MQVSSAIARLGWADAKLIHYSLAPGAASAPSDEDLSLTEPSSISLALLGRGEAVVEKAGVTGRRTIFPGGITLCGSEPLRWLGGSGSSGASEFIEITASAEFRRGLAEELGVAEHFALDDRHGWTDPVIWAIAVRFRSAARQVIALDDLERDTLLRRLYGRVFEIRFGGRNPSRGHGGLDHGRLNRVFEFIEAHLEDRLTIARLAEVAALSPFHFVRAFRRSTGLTPHRYAQARRLERARTLIASGMLPRQVAERIGYQSFSHFRAAYRAHFGFTYEHSAATRARSDDKAFIKSNK